MVKGHFVSLNKPRAWVLYVLTSKEMEISVNASSFPVLQVLVISSSDVPLSLPLWTSKMTVLSIIFATTVLASCTAIPMDK